MLEFARRDRSATSGKTGDFRRYATEVDAMTVSIVSLNHRKQLTWRRRAILAAAAALAAGTILAEVVFSLEPPQAANPMLPYDTKYKPASSTRLSDYIQKSSRRPGVTPSSPAAPSSPQSSRKQPKDESAASITLRAGTPTPASKPVASARVSSRPPIEVVVPTPPVPMADVDDPLEQVVTRAKIDRQTRPASLGASTAAPEPLEKNSERGEFRTVSAESSAAPSDDAPQAVPLPSEPPLSIEKGESTLELDSNSMPSETAETNDELKPGDELTPAATPANRIVEPRLIENQVLGEPGLANPTQRVLRVIGMRDRIATAAPQGQFGQLAPVSENVKIPDGRPFPRNDRVAFQAAPPIQPATQETTSPPEEPSTPEDDDRAARVLTNAAPNDVAVNADAPNTAVLNAAATKALAPNAAVPNAVRQPIVPDNVNRAASELAWRTAQDALAAPADELPFEVIEQTGELKVTMRRSKLLVLKKDVSRIAIVDPNIADLIQFTPRELSVIGKTVGGTHVTFWFDDGNQRPVTYLVSVEPDVRIREQIEEDYRKLEALISELFPDSLVRLVPIADKLIVKGQAKDAEEAAQILSLLRNQAGGGGGGGGGGMMGMGLGGGTAAQLYNDEETGGAMRARIQIVNMLRVPGVHQVALRVKIAEINRTAARNFGVGVGGTVNFNSNTKGSQLFIQSMLGVASGGAAGGGAAAPTFLAQFDGDDIRVGIRFMQKSGVLRLLSEPTLVTLSGQRATFVAGGEFAVPTLVGSVGLNAVTTDFRSFGAIISFLPTIVDKDRIRLQVAPEFSQINSGLTNAQTGTPGLNVRSVTTTVEMREGQTFAIAGLLEDTMKTATGSDLPFLGRLFGAREANREETELIILVTPELVHPMDPEEVPPLPGFDITEPSNYQFYVKGDIEGTPTRDWRSPVWPRLRQRYNAGGSAMISGPFGHGQ